MLRDAELCRALNPRDCLGGAPSQFARPERRRQRGNDVLKLGASAVLTARNDAWGLGKGLSPRSVPSGTLLTANKINKSAPSYPGAECLCGRAALFWGVLEEQDSFFSLSWFTFFPPTMLHCFFSLWSASYAGLFSRTFILILSFAIDFAFCKKTLNQVNPWHGTL